MASRELPPDPVVAQLTKRRPTRPAARRAAAMCALVVAACLAGGFPLAAQAQERPGVAAAAGPLSGTTISPPLSVAWVFSMGPEPENLLAPRPIGDRVYVTHDGKLHCLDARTGAEQWKLEPKEARVTTSPVPVGQRIVVGTDAGELIALNPADGKEAWKTRCGGPIAPDPLPFGDMVILGAREMVYGVNPATGAPKWVSSLTSAASVGPITDGEGVYFLCQDGSVQSIDPGTGRFRWNSQTIHGPRAFPPVMADRRVLVARSSTLMAVARTGKISWTREMPVGIGAQPTVIGDTIYVPCVDGLVHQLFAGSGRDQLPGLGAKDPALRRQGNASRQRSEETPPYSGSATPITAPPLLDGGLMVLGTAGALVNVVDMGTGEVKWSYRCRAPGQPVGAGADYGIYAPLVIAEGALYCITGDGDLYCFRASAGDGIAPRFAAFKPDPGSAQPGKGPLDISFAVTDEGSGVDPTSVTMALDGTPVKLKFDPLDGKGEAHFGSMPDGSHIVKVTAKDFRGNEGSVRWSFLTDKNIRPAGEPGTRGTTPGQTTTLRQGVTPR